MTTRIGIVVRVAPGDVDVLEDTLLSLAGQSRPGSATCLAVEALDADAAGRVRELADAYEPLTGALPVVELDGPLDVAGVRAALRALPDDVTHASVLRAGDALFDHWAETIVSSLGDDGAGDAVRMRFVRQRTERTPAGAPRAVLIPVRPYADEYLPERHAYHASTPSSAVAWPVATADGLAESGRDPAWSLLVAAGERGRVRDEPAITSLVRAWTDDEWAWFERGALERDPVEPPAPQEPAAASAAPGPASRVAGRLRRLLGRG